MRCPFCASPRAKLPECWACGMALEGVDFASVQNTLEALEPTRYAPVEVRAERIHDLQIWTRTAGDEVLTDSAVAATIPCPNCGRGLGLEPVCAFCGAARQRAHAAPEARSQVCCSQCGTPNPPARGLCSSCGTRSEV